MATTTSVSVISYFCTFVVGTALLHGVSDQSLAQSLQTLPSLDDDHMVNLGRMKKGKVMFKEGAGAKSGEIASLHKAQAELSRELQSEEAGTQRAEAEAKALAGKLEAVRAKKAEAQLEASLETEEVQEKERAANAQRASLDWQLTKAELAQQELQNSAWKQFQSQGFDAGQRQRHVFFHEILGGVSLSHLQDMVASVREAVEDPKFMERVSASTSAHQKIVDSYVEDTKALVGTFVKASRKAKDLDALPPLLASLLSDLKTGLLVHHANVTSLVADMLTYAPESLRERVTSLVFKLGEAVPNDRPFLSTPSFLQQLASLPANASCGDAERGVGIVPAMERLERSATLTQAREVINATANIVPLMSVAMPSLTPRVALFAKQLTDAGMVQVSGLETATNAVLQGVGSVASNRLSCEWSGAFSSRIGLALGLVAALAFSLA